MFCGRSLSRGWASPTVVADVGVPHGRSEVSWTATRRGLLATQPYDAKHNQSHERQELLADLDPKLVLT